jgi:hypothetical protein
MNFRLYPILIDLIISQIYDWILLVIQRSFNGIFRFIGAFVHHSHTSYVWLKISTVSESTLGCSLNSTVHTAQYKKIPEKNFQGVLGPKNRSLNSSSTPSSTRRCTGEYFFVQKAPSTHTHVLETPPVHSVHKSQTII